MSGNLTSDPEIRYVGDGNPVMNVQVAHNTRKRDEQGNWVNGDTLFYKGVLWGKRAEHLVENLNKGDRVYMVLKSTIPKVETYTTKTGEDRSTLVFTISDIGVVPRGKTKQDTNAPF
nr:ssb: single-stranded DNA-binding protein [uncultured bacterium]AMP54393.1 ssb: single-stranded DNA-binding protein [uncultured bacterium]AMP54431.1 ssb: single-stranded DNA-binding protein [uncultured bacterium]